MPIAGKPRGCRALASAELVVLALQAGGEAIRLREHLSLSARGADEGASACHFPPMLAASAQPVLTCANLRPHQVQVVTQKAEQLRRPVSSRLPAAGSVLSAPRRTSTPPDYSERRQSPPGVKLLDAPRKRALVSCRPRVASLRGKKMPNRAARHDQLEMMRRC